MQMVLHFNVLFCSLIICIYYQDTNDLKSECTENATCIRRAFGFGAFKEERISVGRATPGRQSQVVPTIDVYPLCPLDPFSTLFLALGSSEI